MVMGDIATTLPAYFGLQGITATKERGYFLCKTEKGITKIYKTEEHHQLICLRHEILCQLDAAGFPWTDQIILSAQGMPYVQFGRETYVMSQHVQGRDINFDCPQDIALAIQSLANFHVAARKISQDKIINVEVSPSLGEIFEKNLAFLTKIVKQTNKNSRLSDFDVVLLKSISKYINYVTESALLLKETDYASLYNAAVAQNHLCHNTLKEESLPILRGRCYITNFSEVTIDAQVVDLANLLHRYARRSQKGIPLGELLEIYDRISPLPRYAMEVVRAYLIHPWQFIKIVQQYYSKKRGWTPVAITSRMNTLLDEQKSYDEYLGLE